ncbi:MAG TPA: hypothetical protein VHI99_01340 [Vicinamibacterales bacterium]|nr:hypothetical protein [Vicinamibacterales bacterium]
MPSVVFYISGHGFGHASRQIEIVNALGVARPDLQIVLRTSAPAWLFERTVRVPFSLIAGATDTGVVQIDSLRLDEAATVDAAWNFHATLRDRAKREAVLLREHDARFVIADAPPLGCAAASLAGLPCVVIANFTWDWIYGAYDASGREASNLVPVIREAYSTADAAWRLPMHGGFASFRSIVDVPFVARHARHSRPEVRERLGLPADRPLVLSSFGGYGVRDLDLSALDCLRSYGVVLTEADAGPPRDGIYPIREAAIYDSALRYEDLVAAVDIVITKPGYGIIAECLANRTALVYTSRGHFREYDVLVAEMPRFLRCAFLDQDALLAGRWLKALDRVMASPDPPEQPATNGAEVIAAMIAGRV